MYQLIFHNLLSLYGHESGHLAAKGDFIYANEQRSTFNYINVAPQVSAKLFLSFPWERFHAFFVVAAGKKV